MKTTKYCFKRKYWNNESVNINDESIIKTNYGNFRSLLRFKPMADFILDRHSKHAISFATYTSFKVQNEIINICGDLIKENILTKIKNTRYFSVLVDETHDV